MDDIILHYSNFLDENIVAWLDEGDRWKIENPIIKIDLTKYQKYGDITVVIDPECWADWCKAFRKEGEHFYEGVYRFERG